MIPSGGFVERFLYSWNRRFCATDDMMRNVFDRFEVVLDTRGGDNQWVGWLGGANGIESGINRRRSGSGVKIRDT